MVKLGPRTLFMYAPADVDEAVTMLDQALPGWHRNVNLNYFDMTDPSKCVLGYNGGFVERIKEIFGLVRGEEEIDQVRHIFSNYTDQWRQVIHKRMTYENRATLKDVDITKKVDK